MLLQEIRHEIIRPATGIADVLPQGCDEKTALGELRSITERFLQRGRPSEHPLLINVSGLPASGKSWYIRELLDSLPGFVYVSFDAVMESCPEYQQECIADKELAFACWEPVARIAGYRLLEECVKRRLPVIFEHSNADVRHLALYRAVQAAGYEVEIRFIDATPDLVLPRLALRDRYFPPLRVMERWKVMQELLPEFEKTVDRFIRLQPWAGDHLSEEIVQPKK